MEFAAYPNPDKMRGKDNWVESAMWTASITFSSPINGPEPGLLLYCQEEASMHLPLQCGQ